MAERRPAPLCRHAQRAAAAGAQLLQPARRSPVPDWRTQLSGRQVRGPAVMGSERNLSMKVRRSNGEFTEECG
jgi:hypothetical protein